MEIKLVHLAAILLATLLIPLAHAQEADEKIEKPKPPREIGMLLEFFEVEHRTANRLVSRFSPRASDAGELRKILGEMVEKEEATLVETTWLRARSGQRVKASSVAENIIPTEYDPPEIPNTLGDSSKAGEGSLPPVHMVAAMPTAYETRHVGLTVEVDPVLSEDSESVYLNMGTDITTRLADQHYTKPAREKSASGIDNISMPTFHKMATTNQTLVISGNYSLHGLLAPPEKPTKRILCLVKADIFSVK